MATFPEEPSITPQRIGDIGVNLYDPDPQAGNVQRARVIVQVIMSNGEVEVKNYNLADHVSAATISQLQGMMATLRTKANTEIL